MIARSIEGGDAKACILAHRDELTAQNRTKFGRVAPEIATSVVDAGSKDWSGQATFAMAPTLTRPANLKAMPALDLLVIDEAHHAVADSYRRIIDRARETNPDCRIFGVTATPNRGDRKGLREIFDNVGDQVRLGELIASGHLVPPRTFVIDVGVQDKLRAVRKIASDFDMGEVAEIMDRAPITGEVIRHWREKAADRPDRGLLLDRRACRPCRRGVQRGRHSSRPSSMAICPARERRGILAATRSGKIRVITNVAVLIGRLGPPAHLLRRAAAALSYKSTMIQMVGRGLRTVDPAEHPGVVKTDCIVLDFGTSSLTHGTLEQDADLDGNTGTGEAPRKILPSMPRRDIPSASRECPICGEDCWSREDDGESRKELSAGRSPASS